MSNPMSNRRVYLAGPDVFYPDVTERSEFLKIQCDLWGLEGVFPLDSEVKLEEPINQEKNGYLIYEGNLKLIKSCAAVLANVSPFRGPSVDAGTAFEIGYGLASGLIVVGYTNDKTFYKDRVQPDGLFIEDFGMIDNLMIHGATGGRIFRQPVEAIGYLANALCK
jgi:nucleoside 2-deoxyribosyltransferase